MVYKSKKINKRKNFKSFSKRNSRRKLYIGGNDQLRNVNSNTNISQNNLYNNEINNTETNENSSQEIMNKIQEQNKVELPSIDEIPVVGPVIEKTEDLVEGSAIKGLDTVGNLIGVDINNPGSITQKLDNISDAVSSPENIAKTKEILGNAAKYGEVLVDSMAPVIEQTGQKVIPIVTNQIGKVIDGITATGVNLAEDVLGPIIGIPRTMLSAAEAFNASVNAGSEIIKGTAEAIQGTQENFTRNLKNMENLGNVPEIPKIPDLPRVNNLDNNLYNNSIQAAGSSLKKFKKQSKEISNRILQSQNDFFNNKINLSNILNQYSNKTKSKRKVVRNHKLSVKK